MNKLLEIFNVSVTSFEFIKSLVEQKLESDFKNHFVFQFKVTGVSIQNFEFEEEDLILSPLYKGGF